MATRAEHKAHVEALSNISRSLADALRGQGDPGHTGRVVPRRSWAKSRIGRNYHLVRDARIGWLDGKAVVAVRGACGEIVRLARFHPDVPDSKFCDACIVGGYRDHVVYRAINAAGTTIYVGYSGCFYERHGSHRRTTPWFKDVVDWVIERYPDEDAARDAEAATIAALQPIHNVHYRGWLAAA